MKHLPKALYSAAAAMIAVIWLLAACESPIKVEASKLCTVTLAQSGEGSVTAKPDQLRHRSGSTILVSAVAKSGYRFSHWEGGSDAEDSELAYTVVGDTTLKAVFVEDTRLLETTVSGKGKLVCKPEAGALPAGTACTISAVADTGYLFSHWSGALESKDAELTFTLDSDMKLEAVFVPTKVSLELKPDAGCTIVCKPEGSSFDYGTTVELTVSGKDGYYFSAWGGDASGSEETLSLTMDGDKTVKASSTQKLHEFSLVTKGKGKVSVTPAKEVYAEGAVVQLIAEAETGWAFTGWSGSLSGSEAVTSLTIDGAKSIVADFEQIFHKLFLEVEGSGSVSRSPIAEQYTHQASVRLSAQAKSGWYFSHWSGSVDSSDPQLDLIMDASKTVKAHFTQTLYTLELSSQGSGSITIEYSGDTEPEDGAYPSGSKPKLSALGEPGWYFSHWTGDASGSQNPLTVTMSKDKQINAVFVQHAWTLDILCDGQGSVLRNPDRAAYADGTRVSLLANPEDGWLFSHWSGSASGTNTQIEVTMQEAKSVNAHFVRSTHTINRSVSGEGSISLVPDKAVYNHGETVTIRATPGAKQAFSGWSGDLSGQETSVTLTVDATMNLHAVFVPRVWTIMVYMSGDNDLEYAMMRDLNQLEAVNLPPDVEILALADRSPYHDNSDGDWTDTRLYRIRKDPAGQNAVLVSQRLSSSELGLSTDSQTDLDLGNANTLRSFIEHAQTAWGAEHYALVVWGHGTGWRSGGGSASEGGWRGFAVDDSSASMMFTAAFGRALAGKNLDLVGMDLCYGGLLEIAYEIRDKADIYVASQEAVPAEGWDYRDVFSRFIDTPAMSPNDLATSIVDSYAAQYASQNGACMSAWDLAKIQAVHTALNTFSTTLAQRLDTKLKRDTVLNLVLNNVEAIRPVTNPGDRSVDIWHLARVIEVETNHADTQAIALQSAVLAARLNYWNQGTGHPNAMGLSVHLCGVDSNGLLLAQHSLAYFKNAVVSEPLSFVRDSSWVPTTPMAGSLLDVLWYKQY